MLNAANVTTFREIDTNGDGTIQKSEVQAFRQRLKERLQNLAGDSGNIDTPDKFQATKDAGFNIDTVTWKAEVSAARVDDPAPPPPEYDDYASRKNDIKTSQAYGRIVKGVNDVEEPSKSFNLGGTISFEANQRSASETAKYGKSYSVDSTLDYLTDKLVGKSVDDQAFAGNSLVSDQERELYARFRRFATLNKDGVYTVNAQDGAALLGTFKLPEDKLPKGQLDPNSQRAASLVTSISCGAKVGETCAALDITTPLHSRDNGTTDLNFTFYGFFDRLKPAQ